MRLLLSSSLLRDSRGLAAIEFALLMPLLLTLFFGGYVLSDAIACNRKVTTTARSVADLTARYTSVSNADVTTILNASTQVLSPYQASLATVRVSQVQVTGSTTATVLWGRAINGTARVATEAVTIPSGMAATGSYLILGEVSYSYAPLFSWAGTGPIVLADRTFMSPRLSDQVSLQ